MAKYRTRTKVKAHTRRVKGRRTYVKPHKRGVIKNYGFTKRTTNRQFRNMDSDKDGIRNIDDCRPFNKKRQDEPDTITLIKLSKRWVPDNEALFRIEGAYSAPSVTIEEARRLYPESQIVIEGKGIYPSREEAKEEGWV